MDTQDKRKEILKAASACFARYGYEKTTLDDIGRLVGLNKASLYYYYKNKESIYTEVIFAEADEFLDAVLAGVSGVPACRDKIRTYLAERFKFIRKALNLNQLGIDSVQKITPLFGEMNEKIAEKEIALLSKMLKNCIESGDILPCDTDRVSRSILTVAEAIRSRIDCRLSTEEGCKMVLEEVDFTVSLILDGLKRKDD